MMTFGERLRALRRAKGLTLRGIAARVKVGFTYLSRIETGRMTYGAYPSAELIRRLAGALDADEEELLLLAEKIPESLRRRIFERPDAFCRIARLNDKRLDRLLALIDGK